MHKCLPDWLKLMLILFSMSTRETFDYKMNQLIDVISLVRLGGDLLHCPLVKPSAIIWQLLLLLHRIVFMGKGGVYGL